MGEWRINPHENLQDVLDIAPPGTVIRLPAGVMRQNIVIRTPGITLIGAGRDQTVLAFDRCAKDMDNVGRPLGTFRSFTLAVTAENVTLRALTVRNDGPWTCACGIGTCCRRSFGGRSPSPPGS